MTTACARGAEPSDRSRAPSTRARSACTTSKATVRRYPQRPWRGCPIRAPASRVRLRCRPASGRSASSSPSRSASTASASGRRSSLGVPLAALDVVELRRIGRRADARCSGADALGPLLDRGVRRTPASLVLERAAAGGPRRSRGSPVWLVFVPVPVPRCSAVRAAGARAGFAARRARRARCSWSSELGVRAALRRGWQLGARRRRARARLARDARDRRLPLPGYARALLLRGAGEPGADRRRPSSSRTSSSRRSSSSARRCCTWIRRARVE